MCLKISGMLQKKKVKSYVASGPTQARVNDNIISLRFLKREISLFWDCLAVAEIFFLCLRLKPDILHLHTSKAGFAGRMGGFMAGVKKIFYQPHGIVFYGYFSRLKSKIVLSAEKLLAPLAEKIIVLTPNAKREFLSYGVGKEKQFRILENGICPENFNRDKKLKNQLRKKFHIKEDELVFGMAGRLVPLKGHRFFIKVFSKLVKTGSKTKAVIIGAGPEDPGLKKVVEKYGLKDKVIFTGYRKDMEKAIQLMDVLIQPSLVEGFGLTLIEAGAAGIPAVGFKVGGIRDIIKNMYNGILVDCKDIKGIYKAMQYFIDNPAKVEDMGKNAKKRVQKHYTLDNMQKKLYRIYGLTT